MAERQHTTIYIGVPVGRDHPLVDAIFDAATEIGDVHGCDAIVMSETLPEGHMRNLMAAPIEKVFP